MRRHESGIGCGARGRGATLLAHPGGAGAPPGDTRIPCEELADGGPFAACPRFEGHGP